jgi:hypothetical protein
MQTAPTRPATAAPPSARDRRRLTDGARTAVSIGAVVVTCAALVVIGPVTRDARLGVGSVHIDDAWVLLGWKAHRFVDVRRAGSTSLGFVLLLRGWLDLLGYSYRNAQLLPLIASVAGAPVFFLVALRMRLRYPAALLGAAMLLASPVLVSYSTRVKQYPFDLLFAIVVLGLGASVVRAPDSTRRWVLLGATGMVGLAVSFAVVGVVAAAVFVGYLAFWLHGRGRSVRARLWSRPSLCAAATGAFAAAWYALVIAPTLSPALRDFWSGFYLSEPRGVPNRAPFWHIIDTAHDGLLAHDWRLVQSLARGAFTGPTTALVVAFAVATVLVAIRRPFHALLFGLPVASAVVASLLQIAPFGGGRVDAWLYAPITFMIVSGVDVVLEWIHDPRRRAERVERPRTRTTARDVVVGAVVVGLAVVWLLNIPEPEVFTWPNIAPLVREMERSRSADDLVVVGGPLMFNYALDAPQRFTTRVSDRNATHFTPIVEGVNAMNWADYPAPMREFAHRLAGTTDVWLLDTPEIIYPLGAAPRDELVRQGFSRVSDSRNGGGVLEHWTRPSG